MDPTMVSTQTLIRQTKEPRLFIENVNVIKLIKYTSLIPSGWDRITLISINLLCVFVYMRLRTHVTVYLHVSLRVHVRCVCVCVCVP